jgi:hypothetical protein
MKQIQTRKRLLTFVVVIAVALFFAVRYFFRSPSAADFRLHQAQYEALVAKIKRLDIPPEESGLCWTNAALEPDSLSRTRIYKDSMVGKISVERTDSGQYLISIITRDDGHFGTFGYVYSEVTGGAPSTSELPSVDRQIRRHWWIAYNNMW